MHSFFSMDGKRANERVRYEIHLVGVTVLLLLSSMNLSQLVREEKRREEEGGRDRKNALGPRHVIFVYHFF